MKAVTAFAPATVANVSCGFDILGFAIGEMGDQVRVALSEEPGLRVVSITGDGGRLPTEPEKNTCTVAIQAFLDRLSSDQGLEISLIKGLPLGSGMGSSAASAAAALMAVNELMGSPFTKSELVPFAMEAERVACGAAHADNVAPSILGGFVLIRDYAPLDIVKLPVPEGLYTTLIHPHIELRTADSRSVLRRQISLQDAVVQSGNIAGLISALYTSDLKLLGRSLKDVIAEPYRALLIPGFYELREAIQKVGALGSGISGSGPTLFVLSESQEIAELVAKKAEELYASIGLGVDISVADVNPVGAYVISLE
ncbi:homoserine kinase [Mongoliitalea daihaiensis]|uniref:homoserine kinase n=1 Tax=Mongoliitalea daihaiensis TaxID=2782006 RepID=UPI001F38EC38|nr:homoserine kinase [Mongoliitalea daihaiensis]UJP66540.1 homoserine kinase [Mongoliitalea daihaiensis]